MTVVIDGVEYVPAGTEQPSLRKLAIGITTRNRPEILATTIEQIRLHTPEVAVIVIDDASEVPVDVGDDPWVSLYRFEENVGIARAKNKAMELLYALDAKHLFLFDDDAYPAVDGWYEPYIDSSEPHLMRIFADLATSNKLNDIHEIYRDDRHVAYTGPRGIMLYVERWVLDVVGGMDVAYGKWGYEHGDWSGRIHNAGLTTWRFADVVEGDGLIYSLDEHEQVDRSVERRERRELVRINVKRYQDNWDSKEYHEFREQEDVVLTCLYSTLEDPQRGRVLSADPALLAVLGASLKGHLPHMVFHDAPLDFGDNPDEWQPQEVTMGVKNLYVQRWVHYWEYLSAHPEVDFVWCVDGTDVEMLAKPQKMDRTKLYLGNEPTTVASGWLGRNSATEIQQLVTSHPEYQLYNAGLVGGTRKIVMEFIHDLLKLYFDNAIDTANRRAQDITTLVNDMGILNVIARSEAWQDRIISGPQVNTTFKGDERNAWSWWKHK